MSRWAYQFKVITITFLLLVGSRSASAAGPAIIMIYGGTLQKPIFVLLKEPADMSTYSFLSEWSHGTPPGEIGGRAYLNIAMFWGFKEWAPYLNDSDLLSRLKPEQANQHGRLYLPTSSEPATVVVTRFRGLQAVPIPTDITQFTSASHVTGPSLETARRLGIPGL